MKTLHWLFALLLMTALAGGCLTSDDEKKDDDNGGDNGITTDPVKAELFVASADSVVTDMMKSDSMSTTAMLDMMEDAAEFYKLAAQNDPDNSRANFGAALFSFQSMMNNEDFKTIRNTLEQWDSQSASLDHPKYYVTQLFMHGEDRILTDTYTWTWGNETYTDYYYEYIDPMSALMVLLYFVENSLSEQNSLALLQNMIDNTLIASLDDAIGYIDKTLAASSFSYVIDKEDTGDIQDWEFDKGEAYMLSATFRAMRAWLKIVNAYQFSVPGASGIANYLDETAILPLVKAADVTNGPFLKLRSTTMLPSAKQDLLAALGNVKSGIAFIEAETDPQTDDLIKRAEITERNNDIDESIGVYDNPVLGLRTIMTITELADKIEDMLASPFDVEVNYGNDQVTTVSVSLAAFLNNGIPDIKKILPYHGWRDLTSLETSFYGWSIESWGKTNIDGVDYNWIYTSLPYYYQEAVSGEDMYDYYDYLGSVSEDGVVTINKKYDWSYWGGLITDMQPNDSITTDGAIYLDSQLRLCIKSAAYNAINSWAAAAPRESWEGARQLWIASNLPTKNYSPEHPFGVRDTSGVFKFSGTPNYSGSVDPVFLTNATGSPLDPDEFPIFPDYTFGGFFPGMTQSKMETLLQ